MTNMAHHPLLALIETYDLAHIHGINTGLSGYWHLINDKDDVVSTDKYGFRNTYYLEKEWSFRNSYLLAEGLILGGSTAFGCFTTNDTKTLASQLSSLTGSLFLSTAQPGDTILGQAMKNIAFYGVKKSNIKNIVCLVGFNELYWLLQTPFLTPFGFVDRQQHFFFGDDTTMYSSAEKRSKYITEYLLKGILEINKVHPEVALDNYSSELHIFISDEMKKHFNLALSILGLCHPNATINIVLQPQAISSAKYLNLEEVTLVRHWFKNRDHNARKALIKMYSHYSFVTSDILEAICDGDRLRYCDSRILECVKNEASRDVYFTDEVHLTDHGFSFLAEKIQRFLVNRF
jgi:hypothetical protein